MPAPNADTIQRRAYEAHRNYFFNHLRPGVWSNIECKALRSAIQHVQQQKQDISKTDETTTAIDYEKVQIQLECTKKRKRTDVTVPRTAIECQIQYEDRMAAGSTKNSKKIKFTSTQIKKLKQFVQQQPKQRNWELITEQFVAYINKNQSQPPTKISVWDCFVAYQQCTQRKLQPWTIQEDELVFKFLMATGSQNIIDVRNSLVFDTLLQRILRTKTKQQLLLRATTTLLNPNLVRDSWTIRDERRLTIFMKMYKNYGSNSSSSGGMQLNKQQLYAAAQHVTNRSMKSVLDKWDRSINPERCTKPFSKDEEKQLVDVVRTMLDSVDAHNTNNGNDTTVDNGYFGWVTLSKEYFPYRHPQRLMNRWVELASDDDIVRRERALQQYNKQQQSSV